METTYLDIFKKRVYKDKSRVALKYKAKGKWKTITWGEWDSQSDLIAAGLYYLGFRPGDKAGLFSGNCPEWAFCDIGLMKMGMVSVPIYPTLSTDQCQYIISHAEVKCLFVEGPALLQKVLQFREQIPSVQKILYFQDESPLKKGGSETATLLRIEDILPEKRDLSRADEILSLSYLIEFGKSSPRVSKSAKLELPDSEDCITIVYTSGTGGVPKGVMISHENLVFECHEMVKAIKVDSRDEQLLCLPLAHVLGRTLLLVTAKTGNLTIFMEDISKLFENLLEIRPTFMCGVPRIYEKIYTQIINAESVKSGLSKWFFEWGNGVLKEVSHCKQAKKDIPAFLMAKGLLADKLFFSHIRELFGGRIRFLISGGAKLSQEVSEFMHRAGILVLEGYGLTETSGATHVNTVNDYRFGTVGKAFQNVEVRIEPPESEILIRGKNVMMGYYKDEPGTAEVLDAEGWLHTGDIGVIQDGYLAITDRKKDIIKTRGGKNISPQMIETLLLLNPYINHACVYGENRNYLSALVTLNEPNIAVYATQNGIQYRSVLDLSQEPRIYSLIETIIQETNNRLATFEAIKKFAILAQDFTIEAGDISPAFKIRRSAVYQKYRHIIESFYTDTY